MGGEAALSVEARFLEPDLPDELQQAYAQTFDRLRRMFRARGCTPEEAADLAQDAAVRAFVHIRRWGVNGTGLDPLLNRIARNLLIDRYRRTTPHIVPLDDAGELQDPDQDPTEEVVRRQRTHAVHSAIQGLPLRHQKAITYSLNGLTPEEVGRRMGIGRNAADALLHRARRSLKERLQTVGEGMFGVALGVRVRATGLIRRAGVESGMGDVGVAAFANAALGIATAAMIAVLAVTGGNGTSGSSWDATTGGFAAVAAAREAAGSAPAGLAPGADTSSVGMNGGSGGSGSNTYSFGPAAGSLGRNGTDNTATVDIPGDPHEEPIIEIHGYVVRRPADDTPEGPVDGLSQKLCIAGIGGICGA
ncbi:MAG: sigma-70 family RNA polymerase sigma factor [Actinomycetota bacterium]